MRKLIYVMMFTFILLFPSNVYADECNGTRINELKEMAKSIEVFYDYDNSTLNLNSEEYIKFSKNDEGKAVPYGRLIVTITGVNEEFSVKDITYKRTFTPSSFSGGILTLHFEKEGNRRFEVYSNSCNKTVRTIYMQLPRYNDYHIDPLCEGIDGNDLAVCNKWYAYDLDYDSFKKKVEDYKQKVKWEEEELKRKNSIIYKVKNFFVNYYMYIIGGIGCIALIYVLVLAVRKRSELE